MTLPVGFLIVGAQKAGTTSLYRLLGRHPDVFLPRSKEVHYFAEDRFYRRGHSYLHEFYEHAPERAVLGGAYVHLLYFPYCAERIYEYNPGMRILALLRNPVDRAYSAYWFARRSGWESVPTFEEALELERARLTGTYTERAELTYVDHGRYVEQLEPYLEQFGRDRMWIGFTEELERDPESVVGGLFEWLGVDSNVVALDVEERHNTSAMPRLPGVQRLLLSPSVRRAFASLVPRRLRSLVRHRILHPLVHWNLDDFQYPPMDLETRERLDELFRPYNRRLRSLLGRLPPGWAA